MIRLLTLFQERCYRRFSVKYMVPGTKLQVKTFSLFAVGRELQVIGRLVDFDMATHKAVVVVSSINSNNWTKGSG
jgi:hypothetical protein